LKIKNLSISGFRSFEQNIVIDNITPLSIFVGPNSAGKSNVIEALATLRGIVNGNQFRPLSYLLFDHRNIASITIIFKPSKQEREDFIVYLSGIESNYADMSLEESQLFNLISYHIEFSASSLTKQILAFTDRNGNFIEAINYSSEDGSSYTESSLVLDEILKNVNNLDNLSNANFTRHVSGGASFNFFSGNRNLLEYKIAKEIASFLTGLKIFSTYRRATPTLPFKEATELDETGSNLVTVMNTLQTSSPREYVRIMEIFSNLIEGVSEIIAPPTGNNVTAKMGEDGLKSKIDLVNMSVGLQQTLILLVAINTVKSGAVICIEEPEIHLHSTSQKRLFKLFQEKSKTNQFFITTHSSVFTDIGNDVTTYLVTKSNARSNILPIKEENNLKFVKQQLGITNADVFIHDYVIFIEGDSEEEAFPIIANAMGYQIDRGIRVFNLRGNGRVKRLRELLSYVKAEDTEVFLIADGDSEVSKAIEDFDREDLIKKEQTVVWDKEFEDIFDNEIILKTVKIMLGKEPLRISEEDLDKNRKAENQKVGKFLQKYLHKFHNMEFKKPEFAKTLATVIAKDIQSNKERKQTQFESKIDEIMSKIGVKRSWE